MQARTETPDSKLRTLRSVLEARRYHHNQRMWSSHSDPKAFFLHDTEARWLDELLADARLFPAEPDGD